MFSEYASRFLAQSQSRPAPGQADSSPSRRNNSDRRRGATASSSRFPGSRSSLLRANMSSPYYQNGPPMSRFPFASRTSQAPLFYSVTEEFREEDDGEEHERDVADFYALQKSRRHFGASHLTESSEIEDDAEPDSQAEQSAGGGGLEHSAPYGVGRGIRSSWTGGRKATRGRIRDPEDAPPPQARDQSAESSEPSSRGKGKMVDVDLDSTLKGTFSEVGDERTSVDLESNVDESQPFQQLRDEPTGKTASDSFRTTLPIPRETDEETKRAWPTPDADDSDGVVDEAVIATHYHDLFWAVLFAISLGSLFATFLLVYFHTSEGKTPLGDTIYTTLRASFHLLAVYTVVATVVSVLWLALLHSYSRPLVNLILVAVPVILCSFWLYPFVSSFKGSWHGHSVQDKVLRWTSFLPAVGSAIWVYLVWKSRHSLQRAKDILDFACRVVVACPGLYATAFANLFAVVIWTWMWIGMFARVFLGGHFSSKNKFIIDAGSWWLGVFFILVYLWTLAIFAGVQRATTAATVSQWYFHRLTTPKVPSHVIVQEAVTQACTTMLGSICLSTFLTLAVRLPLMITPRPISHLISMVMYWIVPAPIATLTNPLTLTCAAIHSTSLSVAAHKINQLTFISKSSPTTTLAPRSFATPSGGTPLLAYQLAKLLLHAIRFITSVALGFGGWVSTARLLEVGGSGIKGSLYAYVVGLLAAAIGWGVLGAMEGILVGVLDALVVCWGSEVGVRGYGEARYCREAGELFGERGRVR